jgi:hypothetical protein
MYMDYFTVVFHTVTVMNLFSPHRTDFSVDRNLSFGNDILGVGSLIYQPHRFQKLSQPDMVLALAKCKILHAHSPAFAIMVKVSTTLSPTASKLAWKTGF